MSKVLNLNYCIATKQLEVQQKQRSVFSKRIIYSGFYGRTPNFSAIAMEENFPESSQYKLYTQGKSIPRRNNRMGILRQEKMVPPNRRHINKNAQSNRVKDYGNFRSHLIEELLLESSNTLIAKDRVNLSVDREKQAKEYLEKQSGLFRKNKHELLKVYDGKYILFEDGMVLDTGDSRVEVAMRAYQKYGMKPLFIEKITSAPDIISSVWTPFSTV